MVRPLKYTYKETNPLILKMRKQFEQFVIDGTIDEMCKKFDVHYITLRNTLYSNFKQNTCYIPFETIIKLSNMFDIPYEEFVDYNAQLDYQKRLSEEEYKEDSLMLKQYALGKAWEEKVLKHYNDRGYFTYKIPTMNSGTVFDIIAVRKGAALMIECKHVEDDKLYYAGSGILKKRDELNHFVDTTGNNIYIYVDSTTTGTWWTTWVRAREIFEKKGYIEKSDCFECDLDNKEEIKND